MLNIVLVEPEIPQNCGNIARTCAATGAHLHLIKPLGFDISDRADLGIHALYVLRLSVGWKIKLMTDQHVPLRHINLFPCKHPSQRLIIRQIISFFRKNCIDSFWQFFNKFLTTGQFLTFSHTCKNLSSDVRIQDLENHNRVDINGKDLSELATIQLGLPFLLVIHGEDEKIARRMLKKYCA